LIHVLSQYSEMTTWRLFFMRCSVCFLFLFSNGIVRAVPGGGGTELAGTIVECLLPATAVTLTLAYKDKPGAFQFGESMLLSSAVTYGLKYGLDNRRPNGGNQSMPSGHASISFTAAEYMRKRYGWKYGIPAYAAASFVAFSRVDARQHRPEDVAVGAGIGIVSSYIFTRPYKNWRVEPQVSRTFWGLSLARSW
jgi:membrane-associated phospholipid phosphatase